MNRGLLVALAIGIAAATGFFVQRAWQPDTPTVEVAAPEATTADPAVSEAPTADARVIPDVLPDYEFPDQDGKPRRLSDWRGQPVMVNYWATWCVPCRKEIPLLNELRAERKAQKLEIIGIAVDFRDDVLAYMQETPISYPVLIGEEAGLESLPDLGIQGLPATVFADSQQRILNVKLGELHRDEAELILDVLASVDSGAVPIEEGRQTLRAGLKEIATRRASEDAAAAAAQGGN